MLIGPTIHAVIQLRASMVNRWHRRLLGRRLRGTNRRRRPQSGIRFRFRFVFVSCVRAGGRGEAAWACERALFVNAGARSCEMLCSKHGCGFCVLVAVVPFCFPSLRFFSEFLFFSISLFSVSLEVSLRRARWNELPFCFPSLPIYMMGMQSCAPQRHFHMSPHTQDQIKGIPFELFSRRCISPHETL